MKAESIVVRQPDPKSEGSVTVSATTGPGQKKPETAKRSPQRLLILEDDAFYAELLSTTVARQWPECLIVVATREMEYRAALEENDFDLVLSDFAMPHFNGLQALALAREKYPEIPFVVVSGSILDNVGVESLRAGATDYVLKDRIARLVPAIQRALDEVEESKHRRRAETAQEDSETLKGAILDAALDCIIVTDAEGRIIEFNPAAEKTFGHRGHRVIGQSLFDTIFPARLREQHRENLRRARDRDSGDTSNQRVETTGLSADGTEFPLEMALVPIRLKSQLVFTAYLRNITERKQAEERVKQIRARLEESNRDLLRRNQEIQSFYHTLSHELKTPLTSAREFVSIVMDELAGPVNPTQAEYLGIAKESCDQLQLCINDLLDTTRLETGKLTLELKPAHLAPLLQRTLTPLRLKAIEKGIQLFQEVQPEMPEIQMDEHRIMQVVTNLMNNALNYTPAGGTVIVRAHEMPGQPDWFQVSISDTGRGIPEAEQEHIFDRLYQVKTGDATSGHGIGLGLYLCRELVQLHGGNIRAQSEPGKGSQFTFVLPKSPESLRLNVLIIDDDPRVHDLSHGILGLDYNVRAVSDGVAGLAEMRRRLPDVVLLDLDMPNLDGPGTMKEIRRQWGTSVPIIVHTANTDADNDLMKQMMEYSPFTMLAKPCPVAQMLETIGRVVRSGDTAIWKRKRHAPVDRNKKN